MCNLILDRLQSKIDIIIIIIIISIVTIIIVNA